MNGIHDLGGMQGMGPVPYERDEPVFHSQWEGRVYAMDRASSAFRRWNIDAWRYDIERLPPAEYLRLSYYERWLAALEGRLVRYGFVSQQELASGRPAPSSLRSTPALTVAEASHFTRRLPSAQDPSVPPLFKVGQRVRTRNIHPTGHTRLPRYARGKLGEIVRDHGVYSFPDTNAIGAGEKRQHLYSVRFAARELWGEAASPVDSICLDAWDEYLEHA